MFFHCKLANDLSAGPQDPSQGPESKVSRIVVSLFLQLD
jgi:hypothetical protein